MKFPNSNKGYSTPFLLKGAIKLHILVYYTAIVTVGGCFYYLIITTGTVFIMQHDAC